MTTVADRCERQQRLGGWAALYVALAYLGAMPYFLLVLKYPGVVDPGEKVSLLARHAGDLQAVYLLTYVVFGIVLAQLVLALHDRLKDGTPVLARAAAAVGLIWALVLVASGLVFNAGVAAVAGLQGTDAPRAIAVWQAIECVAQGLGGSGGEILGGLWVLLVSVAAARARRLPRPLGWLGVVLGAAGVLSVLPVLRDLAYAFGLLQIVWFVGIAIVLLRVRSPEAATAVVASPTSA